VTGIHAAYLLAGIALAAGAVAALVYLRPRRPAPDDTAMAAGAAGIDGAAPSP
jgi:hypothetical protein